MVKTQQECAAMETCRVVSAAVVIYICEILGSLLNIDGQFQFRSKRSDEIR